MHLISPALPVRDHAIVKSDHRTATSSGMKPGKARVHETGDGTAEHYPAESEGMTRMLGVGFPDRGGMSGEAVTHVPA
jgi:hypothetical protein